MKTIEYKFDMDQKVDTPFGRGFITMLGHDESGNRYVVQTKEGSDWYKEDKLSPAPATISALDDRP